MSTFEELRAVADRVASDIAGDFPELDTGYNLYVEELDGKLVGLIDMGDAYREVFTYSGCIGWVEDYTRNPFETEELILRKRERGWAGELSVNLRVEVLGLGAGQQGSLPPRAVDVGQGDEGMTKRPSNVGGSRKEYR